MLNADVISFREFVMHEPLPLAKIQEAVLEFLKGRDDAVLFGAQAVNAYVDEPRATQDVDIMAIGAVTTYATILAFPYNSALISAVFTVIGSVSAASWLSFGTGLRKIITDPKIVRIFNWVMAILLVLSLIPVFLQH